MAIVALKICVSDENFGTVGMLTVSALKNNEGIFAENVVVLSYGQPMEGP